MAEPQIQRSDQYTHGQKFMSVCGGGRSRRYPFQYTTLKSQIDGNMFLSFTKLSSSTQESLCHLYIIIDHEISKKIIIMISIWLSLRSQLD